MKQRAGRLAVEAFTKAKGLSVRSPGSRKAELVIQSGRRKKFKLGLRVRHRKLKGSGEQSHWVTDEGDMDLAWSNVRDAGNIARAHDTSTRTVRRSRQHGQGASMIAMIRLLTDILKQCRADQPWFAASALKWDEAEQKLAIDLGPNFEAKHTTSGWKTLLSRQRLLIGWSSGRVVEIPVLRPPVPLLDTSADCLDSGLHMRHYPKSYVKKSGELIGQILSTALVSFTLSGTDGAYGNLRLVAHEGDVAQSSVLEDPNGASTVYASILCQNHRNGLIEASATSLLGLGSVNAMCSMTGFLRMSGHFARLVLASDVVTTEV